MDIIPIPTFQQQDFSPPAAHSSTARNDSGFAPTLSDAIDRNRKYQAAQPKEKPERRLEARQERPEQDTTHKVDDKAAREKNHHDDDDSEDTSGDRQDNYELSLQTLIAALAQASQHAEDGPSTAGQNPFPLFPKIKALSEGLPGALQAGSMSVDGIKGAQMGKNATGRQGVIPLSGLFSAESSVFDTVRGKAGFGSALLTEDIVLTDHNGRPLLADKAHMQQQSLLLENLHKLLESQNGKITAASGLRAPESKQEFPGYLNVPVALKNMASSPEQQASGAAHLPLHNPLVDGEPSLHGIKMQEQAQSLRQELGYQVVTNKRGGSDTQAHDQGGKNGSQQNNGTLLQQSSTTVQYATAQTTTDQLGSTGIFSSHVQQASQQLGSEAVKAQQLPGQLANIQSIQEDNVINQIVQRFSLQSHLQSSKLSLQLHPAELGQLKIDVVVQDDTIKASIFAHSPQAKEIIEKNLPRLRTALQENGMMVDDLIVTFESDSVDDYSDQQQNLFEEHLATQPHQATKTDTSQGDSSFAEAIKQEHVTTPSGVNLRV